MTTSTFEKLSFLFSGHDLCFDKFSDGLKKSRSKLSGSIVLQQLHEVEVEWESDIDVWVPLISWDIPNQRDSIHDQQYILREFFREIDKPSSSSVNYFDDVKEYKDSLCVGRIQLVFKGLKFDFLLSSDVDKSISRFDFDFLQNYYCPVTKKIVQSYPMSVKDKLSFQNPARERSEERVKKYTKRGYTILDTNPSILPALTKGLRCDINAGECYENMKHFLKVLDDPEAKMITKVDAIDKILWVFDNVSVLEATGIVRRLIVHLKIKGRTTLSFLEGKYNEKMLVNAIRAEIVETMSDRCKWMKPLSVECTSNEFQSVVGGVSSIACFFQTQTSCSEDYPRKGISGELSYYIKQRKFKKVLACVKDFVTLHGSINA